MSFDSDRVAGGVNRLVNRNVNRAGVGAGAGNRTPDLILTMDALCRLSYSGGSSQ